jgi:superfamily II RNA helicase
MSSPSYLLQPNLATPLNPATTPYPSSLPFTFPLDPFQQYAVSAIHQEHNVLVCAKTGSGKTLVGEYQIYHSLAKGKRVFYTTPIKSLSNQKFYDLKKQFPDNTVGILTGDIKFNPMADILVMTTEILRNLLYKKGTRTESLGLTASLSLDNLDAVIFDECHYINDPDRGKVWEETMILLPVEVRLVLLSATLGRPELFAAWLGALKKVPVHLLQTTYRIVPLTHSLLATDDKFMPFLDHKEHFHETTYRNWLLAYERGHDDHRRFQEKVRAHHAAGGGGGAGAGATTAAASTGAVSGKTRPKSFVHQLNHAIGLLESRVALPALFFVLSRKQCEEYAAKVEHTLLDTSDQAAVRHIINFHLHPYMSVLETLPQYHTIRDLLQKGVAFHHSGLLPLLKEIVELLFSKGYVKVLFATETFAVGLNMPTKTAVFVGLKKFDDQVGGMRLLRTDEYIQMAGRAGRRGKDTEGLVLYLPDRDPIPLAEMTLMLNGTKRPVQSKMDFHYDFLLKTIHTGTLDWLTLLEQSYWYQQRREQIAETETNKAAAQGKVATLLATALPPPVLAACEARAALEEALKTAQNAKRRDVQRDLERWKNTHMGPVYANGWIAYASYQKLQQELATLEEDLKELAAHTELVRPRLAFLQAAGYLEPADANKLTLRGTLATEVNEGNPLLMVELFLSKAAHGLPAAALATLLSVFLEASEKSEMPDPATLRILEEVRTALYIVDEHAYRLLQVEKKHGCYEDGKGFWDLTTQWAEPVYRWLTESDTTTMATLCTEYGLFEGNFVRGLLKIANLLDEWLSLATLCEHTDQLEKIEAVRPLLLRGAVMTDSLYLHL